MNVPSDDYTKSQVIKGREQSATWWPIALRYFTIAVVDDRLKQPA